MRDTRFTKFLVLVNGVVPLVLLGWDALNQGLGANPVNFAIRTTGTMTLLFLGLTLLVTPLRKLTGQNWLLSVRRTLGLYAFWYGATHFALFFVFDRSLSITDTLTEMVKRVYLIVGSLGLILMIPLAVTSTNAMVRKLGAKRWQLLHRLTYLSAVAGVVHYYMLVKSDVRIPIGFAVAVGVLLGYRGVTAAIGRWRTGRKAPRTGAPQPAPTAPARAAARPKFWSGQLRVARIFQETPQVRTFRLVPPGGGPLPFDYLPGQYLNVSLEVSGRKVNRSYTIASSPTRLAYCELTVKREEEGTASRHLHDSVREGDLLRISAPAGSFTFNGSEAEGVVLLGAGVGITPLMSVVRALTDRGWTGEIHLLHCVRNGEDAIFADELAYLERRFPNLKVTRTLTRPAPFETVAQRGRIDAALIARAVPSLAGKVFHICGPDEMMEATRVALRSLGVPDERVKLEAFTRPVREEDAPAEQTADSPTLVAAQEPTAGSVSDATVEFERSMKTAASGGWETVLEAAESAGVEIAFECRSGICGTCKKRLLSGSVTMEVRDGLSTAEELQGVILTCQARPAGNVKIDA